MADGHLLLLGTHDVYVHTVVFNEATKSLQHVRKTEITRDPSWLTRHPILPDIVYSNGHVEGKIFCLNVSGEGKITVLDEAVTGGKGPTHLAVTPDGTSLLIAHYGQGDSGLLSAMPLDVAGRFTRKDTDKADRFYPAYRPSSHPRLDAPHVHQIIFNGDQVVACDLGNNLIWRLVKDPAGGWKTKSVIDDFEPGDGPRHAVIHPNGKYIYVLDEVSSHLSVHTLTDPSKVIARFSLLPEADKGNPDMIAAGIALLPPLSPSGKSLLILTNRNSKTARGDALALFTVSEDGASVERAPTPFYHGIGVHIRALGADESGRYVVTAGRDSGGVVMLERSGDGTQLVEVARIDIPNVVVPLWLS